MQNALLEHSAILLTYMKLPFCHFKTFVLSNFEWPLKTGFTVHVLLCSDTFPTSSTSCSDFDFGAGIGFFLTCVAFVSLAVLVTAMVADFGGST